MEGQLHSYFLGDTNILKEGIVCDAKIDNNRNKIRRFWKLYVPVNYALCPRPKKQGGTWKRIFYISQIFYLLALQICWQRCKDC